MATVAEILVRTLKQAGVQRVYGLPGDSANAILDSLRKHPELEWIHVRNEEAAAFAAGADAQLTGRLSVMLGSCGPGNLHFINGLFDCYRSRVPVLAIATQIPSSELGTNYFQETHPEQIFQSCSSYIGSITRPSQMPNILGIAMRTAIAEKNVAVVVIPGDVLMEDAVHEAIDLGFSVNNSTVLPEASLLAQAAQILDEAEKVTILAGAGCAGAHHELIELASKLQAPIVHAFRGKPYVEYDNPFDVGMTGLLGFSSGYHAMEESDVLLVVGSDFPYPQFYPTHAKTIQIDIRGEQIGRRTVVDVGLIGSAAETMAALGGLFRKSKSKRHLERSLSRYKASRDDLDQLAVGEPGTSPLHPEFVASVLNEMAAEDAAFTVDVGTPCIWAARYLRFNGKRSLIGSFSHGSMANALPQALGAQAAARSRQVITLSGDGGLAMLMGELLTTVQNKLPIKIIVFNNSSLAFVEVEMMSAGIDPYGTDLKNPTFSQVAEACGLFGQTVDRAEDLRPALKVAFDHDGPALVDVHVHRRELSIPPTITAKEAAGFGLYLLKCVLNGKGDEIEDLAKTNLVNRILGR